MKNFTIYLICLLVALVLIVLGVIFFAGPSKVAAPVNTTPQTTTTAPIVASDTVMIASGTGGQYLVGTGGKTLYYFTKDTATKNNCTGACAGIWPVFYTENVVVSAPLQQSDFTTITTGGVEQTVYKGHPLYYYSGDVNPGDTLGNGVNGFWFLVQP